MDWKESEYFNHGLWCAFERVMVWNRILTQEEAYDAMADATGRNVEIGVVNDSADEFGASESTETAEVYDAVTMTWNRLRKELTAEHPSLKIRLPVPNRESGVPRTLTVDPILESAETTAQVSLTINDKVVAVNDLADATKRTFYIPKDFVVPDVDGKMTVVLTRVGDMTGSLAVDHISFGGGWQIGSYDGSEPFVDNNYRPNLEDNYVESLLIDDKYSTQYPRLLSAANSEGKYASAPLRLRFDVPAAVTNCESEFVIGTLSNSSSKGYTYSHQTLSVYVNGQLVKNATGFKDGTAQNKLVFLPGTFHAGQNVLSIVNTTDVSQEPSFWNMYTPTFHFSAFRLGFKVKKGLMFYVY